MKFGAYFTFTVLISAASVFAQTEDDVTNFDDFFDEGSSNTTTSTATEVQNKNANDSQIDVTVLDEIGIEGDGINEAAPVDKKTKAESVKVMDTKELQGSSATIADATNRSSGVKVRQAGGMGSESKINIRGMEGKNVKVLVDGVPVNNGNGDLSVNDIPMDKIDRIEVYKSYVPERFSTDGMGGVINIVTHNLPKNSITGSYSFGSFNTHKASLDAKSVWVTDSSKSRSIETGLSAYYNYSDNDFEFTTPYMDTVVTRDHDRYYSYNIAPFINFNRFYFDRISLGAGFSAMDKEIQATGHHIEEAFTDGFGYGASLSLEKNNLFTKGLSAALSANFAYGEDRIIDTSHVYYYGWDTETKKISEIPMGEISMGGAAHIERKNITLFTPWNLNYAFNQNHSLTWSGLYRYESQDPTDKRAKEGQLLNNAGFPGYANSVVTGLSLENNFWNSRIQNVAGVKGYYYNIKADDVEGKLNALTDDNATNKDFGYSENLRVKILDQLSVIDQFAIKGGYQHSLRFPTREEIFGDGIYVQCAPNLKPEKSDNFTAGAELDLKGIPIMLGLHLEYNWFYLLMDDRIYWNNYSAVPRPYYNSVGIKTSGFEIEASADATEYVTLNFNLTKQNPESRKADLAYGIAKGLTVPNIPTFFINFGAEFHIGDLVFKDDFFKLYWFGNYTDEYYYTWKVSKRQDRTIPSSFSQDLGVEYSILANTLSWSFEIRNITDTRVYDKYGESKPGRAFATKIRFSL